MIWGTIKIGVTPFCKKRKGPRKGCPRVQKFCMGCEVTRKIIFGVLKKNPPPHGCFVSLSKGKVRIITWNDKKMDQKIISHFIPPPLTRKNSTGVDGAAEQRVKKSGLQSWERGPRSMPVEFSFHNSSLMLSVNMSYICMEQGPTWALNHLK